ncbi:MAG: right-handed parallel beta-helix repeat-containing protein [Bacteroidota bacterium]
MLLPFARVALAAALLSCALPTVSGQLYVAPDAAPGGDGSEARPFASITAAAAAARPGDTVLLRRGVYYETLFPSVTGTPDARITFEPAPGDEGLVVVSGAHPIPNGWTREGDTWVWRWTESGLEDEGFSWVDFAYPPFDTDNDGNPLPNPIAAAHVMNRIVLVAQSGQPVSGALADDGAEGAALWDGHPLLPVATRAEVSAQAADPEMQRYGSYYAEFDPDTGVPTLYVRFFGAANNAALDQLRPMLGVRPWGFRPDVNAGAGPASTVQRCGSADSPGHFLVRDVIFRHTNNFPTQGAICPGGQGSRFEFVTAEFHPAIGFQMGADRDNGGRGHFIENTVAQYNGQIGIEGICNDCYFIDTTVRFNNARGYDNSWEAGGMKLVYSSRNLVRRLRAEGNRGPGLWFDTDASENVVEGSYFLDNWFAGVFLELNSRRTLVQHNVIVRTVRPPAFATDASGAGILTQATSDNTLVWNTITGNEGNGVYIRDLAEVTDQVHNTRLYNNLIVGNATLDNRPDLAPIGGEGYEIQLESARLDIVRTNTLAGNRILSHDGDPTDASHAAFAMAALDQPWVFRTTNDLAEWRDLMAYDASYTDALLPWDGDAYTELWRPANWDALRFDADSRLATEAPACPRFDCLPSCFDRVGANPIAVRTPFLDADDAEDACARTVDAETDVPTTASLTLGAPYPNPTSTSVRFDVAATGTYRLEVVDMLGRRILSREVALRAATPLALDARRWTPGLYLIRLLDASARVEATHTLTVAR